MFRKLALTFILSVSPFPLALLAQDSSAAANRAHVLSSVRTLMQKVMTATLSRGLWTRFFRMMV